MQFKTKNKINAQFSMSSMTDIIFLLLIFLLVTTHFLQPTGITVTLPVSNHSTIKASQVNITITAELEYYVDNKKVMLAQLMEILESKFTTEKRAILLSMDKTVPVAYMIKVADIANKLNASVAVATALEDK